MVSGELLNSVKFNSNPGLDNKFYFQLDCLCQQWVSEVLTLFYEQLPIFKVKNPGQSTSFISCTKCGSDVYELSDGIS